MPARRGYAGTTAALKLPVSRSVSLVPSVEGEVDEFKVRPELPAGLELDPISGVISGMSITAVPVAAYNVTAENETGYCRTNITFAVNVMPPESLSYTEVDDVYHVGESVS